MTAIQQSGTITRNHLLTWAAPGVVQDAGSSATPGVNSLGIFGNGGTPLTLSNVTTPGTPTGPYSQLGLGISQTAAYLSVQSYNGAAPLPFNFIVNGQTALAISSNGTLNLTGANLSLNSLTLSTPLGGSSGGTGVNNGSNTLTLGGNLTTSGAFATTLTVTGVTNVTLPTTGTLAAVGNANTWANTQSLTGSSSVFAGIFTNAAEVVNVVGAAPSSTQTFYLNNGSVQYYTTNAANNWTLNIAFSSGTTLNTALSTNQSVAIAMLATQGATAYYNTAVQVDGTTSGVTTYWQGGTAPTKGNASGIDVYTYTVIKTASATYTVLASQVQY